MERIHAFGHRNVRATHKTTIEFTKEEHLTLRGDCVIAVSADKGPRELPASLAQAIRRDDSKIEVTIESAGLSTIIHGRGSSKLTLDHPTDFVIRRSGFACPRTLMIGADMAAIDLPRKLVGALRVDSSRITITIGVTDNRPE